MSTYGHVHGCFCLLDSQWLDYCKISCIGPLVLNSWIGKSPTWSLYECTSSQKFFVLLVFQASSLTRGQLECSSPWDETSYGKNSGHRYSLSFPGVAFKNSGNGNELSGKDLDSLRSLMYTFLTETWKSFFQFPLLLHGQLARFNRYHSFWEVASQRDIWDSVKLIQSRFWTQAKSTMVHSMSTCGHVHGYFCLLDSQWLDYCKISCIGPLVLLLS